MNLNLRSFLPLALAALTSVGIAHADTFHATVYADPTGQIENPNDLKAMGTFTTDNLNFNIPASGYTVGNPNYTIGAFLAGGSNVVIDPTLAAQSIGLTEIVFTGTTQLVNGQTYTFIHDDGIYLTIDPDLGPFLNSQMETAPTATSFLYTGATGLHNFSLTFDSHASSPSVLQGSFTATAATPEPSSLLLLGSGLLTVAGAARRNLQR